jgi:hypothetical protein
MIPGRLDANLTADVQPEGHELRLRMKPASAAPGYVDGGWWPWSDDPAAEFPALITALADRVGPVVRISYHLDGWSPVTRSGRKLVVGGHNVRMEGFRTMDRHTVVVIGTNSRRVSLLVVPPDTQGGVARAVLRSAAGDDQVATVDDILGGNGVLVGRRGLPAVAVPRARTVEPVDEERWEAEGGHVYGVG